MLSRREKLIFVVVPGSATRSLLAKNGNFQLVIISIVIAKAVSYPADAKSLYQCKYIFGN